MSGYGFREQPMQGVHDDIWVRCVSLEQDGRQVAICSIEILSLEDDQVQRIRESVASAGYRPEDMILSCTHTHGGPAVQYLRLCGTPSPEYQDFLIESISQCILEAGQSRQECLLSVGAASSGLGVNRRKPSPRGLLHELNPDGHTEPELVAAQLKRPDGEVMATIFNYGCHGVCMGADNRLITGDWPGRAARSLEAEFNAPALFLQGCSGDVNPFTRDTYETVDVVAAKATDAVHAALAKARPVEGAFENWRETVALPVEMPPSEAELQALLARIQSRPKSEWQWMDKLDAAWSNAVLENSRDARRREIEMEIGGVRLMSPQQSVFEIVWIGAEAFSTYASHIKENSRPAPVMVTAYTNGNIGYLPDARAFPEGGYEVEEAYKLYGYQMITAKSEDIVLKALGISA